MRPYLIPIVLLLVSLFFLSCSAPSSLGQLNLDTWREDRGACMNKRKGEIGALNAEKAGLLGKSSNEIGRLFGAPDIQQLGSRNLKIYIYFLEEGPHCQDKSQVSDAEKAVFRFNAVSLLTEINFQRTMPE